MSGKKKPASKTKPSGGLYGQNISNKKDGNTGNSSKGASTTTTTSKQQQQQNNNNNNETIQSVGYLITCDVPTKQYIQYLNELKPVDKKFILQDLDSTHLLIESKAREEVERKIEDWLDENIFSAVEKVGEDFDMS